MSRFIKSVSISKIEGNRVFISIVTHQGIIETSASLSRCIKHNPIRESKEISDITSFCKATRLALEDSDLNWIRKQVNRILDLEDESKS